MSLDSACPHCQTLLVLPEGCGGLTAKCPSCDKVFEVPGASGAAPAGRVCAVVAPVAGEVSYDELERLTLSLARLLEANVASRIELDRARRRERQATRRLWLLEFFQSTRESLDHSFGRYGGMLIFMTAVPAVLIVLASPFSPSALAYVLLISFGLVLAATLYTFISFYPADAELAATIPLATDRLRLARAEWQERTQRDAAERADILAAEQEQARIKTALESRLHWLRTCQWQEMSGRAFANFVSLVLEEHHYAVRRGEASGASAADLVASRDAKQIAVILHGDPGTAVEASAVNRAQAAATQLGCQASAVVTNARFTAGAQELAGRSGCKLVDAGQIADLIEGRVFL
ncbi:MAG TPA: restriction endonuclease [Pirellulales bacterium]|jgi:HJR/Mrr/RecB family endonuclease|nr:restriction endonuclease [Pirellulales bacterium]